MEGPHYIKLVGCVQILGRHVTPPEYSSCVWNGVMVGKCACIAANRQSWGVGGGGLEVVESAITTSSNGCLRWMAR